MNGGTGLYQSCCSGLVYQITWICYLGDEWFPFVAIMESREGYFAAGSTACASIGEYLHSANEQFVIPLVFH